MRRRLLATRFGFLLGVLGLAACADDPTPTTPTTPATPASPVVTACRYLADPTAATFNAVGGTGSALVSTATGCHWTAVVVPGAESWLRIDSQGPSVGPGFVQFTLQPNRSFSGRTGSFVTVDDDGEVLATYSVTERAAGCLYSVDAAALALTWMGTYDGAGDSPVRVGVLAEPADCQWTASPSVPWIKVWYGSATGRGSGTLYVSLIQWNYSPFPRAGNVVVAGLSGLNPDARFVVTQGGR